MSDINEQCEIIENIKPIKIEINDKFKMLELDELDAYYKNREEIYNIALKDELNDNDIKDFNLLKNKYVNIRQKYDEMNKRKIKSK